MRANNIVGQKYNCYNKSIFVFTSLFFTMYKENINFSITVQGSQTCIIVKLTINAHIVPQWLWGRSFYTRDTQNLKKYKINLGAYMNNEQFLSPVTYPSTN